MFRVAGKSMSPILNDGDYVVTKLLLPEDRLEVDDVVVFDCIIRLLPPGLC